MDRTTRQHLLEVALRHFANRGYAGTSVQDIVDEAGVAKPMLYYYFESKEGLYQALIDHAHDERYRVMREAAESADGALERKLEAILTALFKFMPKNREVVRLAFATAFAAPGELPPGVSYLEKCGRNFEFAVELMEEGMARGELRADLEARELAMAWNGLMNIYVMGQIFRPEMAFSERTARGIVEIFLRGAAAREARPRAGAARAKRKEEAVAA